MDDRIARVIEVMAHNLNERISISVLARGAGMSEPHFYRLFKLNIGKPPKQYLKELRLGVAKHLLSTHHLGIKEVVIAVGWIDRSNFSRAFRRKYGLPPASFRRISEIRDRSGE